MSGRPYLYDESTKTLVTELIRDGMSHRAVAAKTGISKSTVGKIAVRTGARRTDGELRGGSRVHGRVNKTRRHVAIPRAACVTCFAQIPIQGLASGWCVPCLRTPPVTCEKVEILAKNLSDDLCNGTNLDSARVFAAALLLPAGEVQPEAIRTLVGNGCETEEAIKRYTEQRFFSANGWLSLDDYPNGADDVMFAIAIMCGAGEVERRFDNG